ncbi:MAG: flagellar FliJ family protein [Rhodobacteraceae bacterium]|jgi:flagellar biosynthesis chaperone FliJ|nr:flagellar FliJ family protein [Paracoccaceae bacterium]
MAADRRISALEVLQRLKQQTIDGISVQLKEIRLEQTGIHREMEELQDRAEQESRVTSPEALPFLADFLRALDQRKEILKARLKELDHKAEELEDQLVDAFAEVKKGEVVLDLARQKIQLKERRRETDESAEIAQNIFLRGQSKL